MSPRDFALELLLPVISMVFGFATFTFLVVTISRARQRRIEIQAELQGKLIEKFGTSAELVAFLQSPAGRDFVAGVQRGNMTLVRDRVLSGYRRAIILAFLGAAFVVLWLVTDINGLAWPGILILAMGLGYLFATMVTAKLAGDSDLQHMPSIQQQPPSSSPM